MKSFSDILNESNSKFKLKLKRVSNGVYDAKFKNINIDVYKSDTGDYWSSTVVIGKYGDDDWNEEVFTNYKKKDVIQDIEFFIQQYLNKKKKII